MLSLDDWPLENETGALPGSLKRALRRMKEAPAHRVTVEDLARVAGVSPRTLQRQFREFLGRTPLSVLQAIRLGYARRELLRGEDTGTVSTTAMRWGFSHLGRFAAAYRKQYNESPFQTLNRVRAARGKVKSRLSIVSRSCISIAVLPMVGRHVAPGVASDVTDEIITALIRSGVPVADRPESARYHLRGSCRINDGRIRVILHLLNAEGGRHIAAFEHEAGTDEVSYLGQQFADIVSRSVNPTLRAAEAERVRLMADTSLTAEELTVKAWPHVVELSAEGCRRAIDLLERAMERDPRHAMSLALAAWCHAQSAVYQFAANTLLARTRALEIGSRAVSLGGDGLTFAILGHAFACAHELVSAEEVTLRALRLDGGSAWAWGRSAWLRIYNGDAAAAIERFTISLDLAPRDQLVFNNYAGLGCAYLQLGRYAEAAKWMARAVVIHPPAAWAHRILCPIYLLHGQRAEAERSLAIIRRLYPGSTASECARAAPLPARDQDFVAEGLHTLGLRP